MRTEILDITPEMAARWLERNSHNRFLAPGTVAELSTAMTNGTWRLTHQGIAISSEGDLVDGQHRLAAVVHSRQTVRMAVTFDAEMDTFGVLDAGKKRSIADLVTVERGHKYAALIASTCRMIQIADLVAVNDTSPWNTGGVLVRVKADRATIAEHTLKIADAVSELIGQCKMISPGFKLTGPFVAALYVIQRDTVEGPEQTHEFMRGTLTGEGLEAGDIRIRLRDSLLTIRRGWDPRLTFMVTIKSWNMFVEGVTVSQLRFRRTDYGLRPQ